MSSQDLPHEWPAGPQPTQYVRAQQRRRMGEAQSNLLDSDHLRMEIQEGGFQPKQHAPGKCELQPNHIGLYLDMFRFLTFISFLTAYMELSAY